MTAGFKSESPAGFVGIRRARDANGHTALWEATNALEHRILALVEHLRGKPATTVEGIALKMRLVPVDPCFEDEVHADLLAIALPAGGGA